MGVVVVVAVVRQLLLVPFCGVHHCSVGSYGWGASAGANYGSSLATVIACQEAKVGWKQEGWGGVGGWW